MKQEPVLSFAALARVVMVGLVVYLAWKGLAILVTLIIALTLSVALYPVAVKLHKKIPWGLSVLLVVLLLLIPIIAILVFTTLIFVQQFPQMVQTVNVLLANLTFVPQALKNIDIMQTIQGNAGYVLDSTRAVITVVGSIVTVIVASFYCMYDFERLSNIFIGIVPSAKKEDTRNFLGQVASVVGHYIRGNLIISVICTIVMFIGLTLLGIPFAIPIAIFTGVMDLLPMIGPILAIVPPLVLGFSHSPAIGFGVLALYVIYQQVENNLISPFMYNKALNLSPALVFLSVIIGAGLFGIIGAFLALPVAASIPVVVKYLGSYTTPKKY
jgi:predicted PurR-regulated permease PerM